MKQPIKRAAINRIAKERRVSFMVASHIYECLPITIKQRMCASEQATRRALEQSQSQEVRK